MEQRPMQKLLLMGPGGAGKTCMRSIIFDNYLPRDALRLGITISLDQSQVHILRNLFLNLWDCGGQHRYVAEYLNRQREYIFRHVAVMLFVFDMNSMSRDRPLCVVDNTKGSGATANDDATTTAAASASATTKTTERTRALTATAAAAAAGASPSSTDWRLPEMLDYFQSAMRYIRQYSPQAKVFVLLHKMDLIAPDMRERIVAARRAEILRSIDSDGSDITFYATSIWSDSLYLAYGSVVRSLVPHRDVLVRAMRSLALACDAAEVALYERSTFLCLAHVSRVVNGDGAATFVHDSDADARTTQVSEIVKHFKLSCMNSTTSLSGLQLTTSAFTALLHPFTDCTHVLVVSDRPHVRVELHRLNVDAARRDFQHFLASDDAAARAMRDVL